MKISAALRFAKILFFTFLLAQLSILGWSFFLWNVHTDALEADGSMHFAVGVMLSLFAIITYVLLYAQAMLHARSSNAEEEKLRHYRKGHIWRNIVCLIPSVITLAGIMMTQQASFFFIGVVNVLIHIAYLPANKRLKREVQL